MAKIKKIGWFEKQKNDVPKRISWYWFIEPETPSSISRKLYPKKANTVYKTKQGKIKPFVAPSVSSHKDKKIDIGYKDYTPSKYFDIIKKDKLKKYDKEKLILNLNFLFDYLNKKGLDLKKDEKEEILFLFNNPSIRNFLFDCEKYKNEELSHYNEKVYDFKRDVIDSILTFFRCIYYYSEFDFFMYVLDSVQAKKYLKITPIIKEFKFPRKDNEKIDTNLMFERKRIYEKIEELFLKHPALKFKNCSIDLDNPKDIGEKKIFVYLSKLKPDKEESLLLSA